MDPEINENDLDDANMHEEEIDPITGLPKVKPVADEDEEEEDTDVAGDEEGI